MNPLIPLLTPEVGFSIGFIEVLTGGDLQEVLNIPDDSFDSPLFVGPAGVAGVDGKAIVAGKIQELRVEGDLWGYLEDHALKTVIAVAVGHPADLLESPQVAVQEKLQGM